MTGIHDNQSRQELFSTKQDNDNRLPTTSTDFENSETVLYEMGDGAMEVFPHFCLARISKPKGDRGLIHIIYNTGNIIITGRKLEELVKRLAARKIAVVRVTPPLPENGEQTNNDLFHIDSITFEEN